MESHNFIYTSNVSFYALISTWCTSFEQTLLLTRPPIRGVFPRGTVLIRNKMSNHYFIRCCFLDIVLNQRAQVIEWKHCEGLLNKYTNLQIFISSNINVLRLSEFISCTYRKATKHKSHVNVLELQIHKARA